MKKIFIFIVFLILAIGIILLITNLSNKNFLTQNSIQSDSEKQKTSQENKNLNQTANQQNNGQDSNFESSSSGDSSKSGSGGAGGGGSGNGGEDGGGTNGGNEQDNETSCELVRPGNIPGASCSVNYITISEVSLKFTNAVGSPLITTVSLANCAPSEITKTIQNAQSENFVFSCNAVGFFEEEVHIIYQLEGQTIEIFGVVRGRVL